MNIYYAPWLFWVLGYSGEQDRPRAQIEWIRHVFPECQVELQGVKSDDTAGSGAPWTGGHLTQGSDGGGNWVASTPAKPSDI